MKLVASMPVYNEMNRHLELVIGYLARFCDEIRCMDDGSTDGTYKFLKGHPSVSVTTDSDYSWREHEGKFRQALLHWTMDAEPTHILAIDADELIPEGEDLRHVVETSPMVRLFTLRMCEVWSTKKEPWLIRWDGGWVPHETGILYRVKPGRLRPMRLPDKKMASGRIPVAVMGAAAQTTGLDILHLGWADRSKRKKRHQRYQELDGGNFHSGTHLDSIMFPDTKCDLRPYEHELDKDFISDVNGLVAA